MKLNQKKSIEQYACELYKLEELIVNILSQQGFSLPIYNKLLRYGEPENAAVVISGRGERHYNTGLLIKFLKELNDLQGYWVDGKEVLTADEFKVLKKIFPNKEADEMYAIHYLYSVLMNKKWANMPNEETKSMYLTIYHNSIKGSLTHSVIEAICHAPEKGLGTIDYLDKIYDITFFGNTLTIY